MTEQKAVPIVAYVEREPSWLPLYLRCLECQTPWQDWQPMRVRVNIWIACIEGVRCPVCQADKRFIQVVLDPEAELGVQAVGAASAA